MILVDDFFFFCVIDEEIFVYIKKILWLFYLGLGFEVNFYKSMFYGINMVESR